MDGTIEIWKAIPDTDNLFEASTLGRIRSVDHMVKSKKYGDRVFKGTIFIPYEQNNKYLTVCIKVNGKVGKQLVHRVIAKTFIETNNYSLVVMHKNNIKSDNRVINLRWGTQKTNVRDSYLDGIRKMAWEHRFSKYSIDTYRIIINDYNTGIKKGHIAKKLNIPRNTIYNIILSYNSYKERFDKMLLNEPLYNV